MGGLSRPRLGTRMGSAIASPKAGTMERRNHPLSDLDALVRLGKSHHAPADL
jgi:hypothetical protein